MNILLVMSDDAIPGQDMFTAGMPKLNSRLAADGKWVAFPNASITIPVCYDHRLTQHSAKRADRCGGGIPDTSEWGPPGFDESKSIYQAINNAGYNVGAIGKYINAYPWNFAPWNHSVYAPPGLDWMRLGYGSGLSYYDYTLIDESLSTTVYGSDPADYRSLVETGLMLDFLNQAVEPWALFYWPFNPHQPFIAPPAYTSDPAIVPRTGLGIDNVASDGPRWNQQIINGPYYLSSLSELNTSEQAAARAQRLAVARAYRGVDDALDGAIAWLSANNQLESTVIIYYTDNGGALGDYRLDNRAYKRHPFQCSLDPTLYIRHPSLTHSGVLTRNECVSTLDIPALLLDLAGATALDEVDGESFKDVLLGTPETDWDRGRESFQVNPPVVELTARGESPSWWVYRHERWKYIEMPDDGSGLPWVGLFDFWTDPNELNNVASANPDVVEWLAARLRYAKAVPRGNR